MAKKRRKSPPPGADNLRHGQQTEAGATAEVTIPAGAASTDETDKPTRERFPVVGIGASAGALDISLKAGTGLDVIKQLRPAQRARDNNGSVAVKILVHSAHDDSLYAERVLQAGAMGYINKQEAPELLEAAARRILSGKVYVSPQIAERLLNRAIGHRSQPVTDGIASLSDRELQVFRLIGKAVASRRIAEQLFISVHTVETHRENIKKKLGLKTGPELSQRAVQWVLENG
ncbi:MAG: response regulator transcription factor [Planctomycetaceae bacterium]